MQTEFKFRAWWKGQEKFDYIDSFKKFSSYSFPLDWCIIQQWTRLLDKNGVEIYEGDILKISNVGKFVPDLIDETWKEGEEYVVSVVRSRMGEYYGQNTKTSWYSLLDYENWEVIGNIFENPELLNQ